MDVRSMRLTIVWTADRVSHGGRGSRPEKNMLYSASSRFSSASSSASSRSIADASGGTHRSYGKSKVETSKCKVSGKVSVKLHAIERNFARAFHFPLSTF